MTRSLFALVIAATLFAGCAKAGGGGRARTAPSANPIPTVSAKVTTVRATSTISGVIAPLQNVAITSQLAEPADSVAVNEGDRVHSGEVIAVLDTADLRAQLAQAVATVDTDQRTAESDDAKVAQSRYTLRLNIDQGGDQVQTARAALAQANQTLTNDRDEPHPRPNSCSPTATSRSKPSISRTRQCKTTARRCEPRKRSCNRR